MVDPDELRAASDHLANLHERLKRTPPAARNHPAFREALSDFSRTLGKLKQDHAMTLILQSDYETGDAGGRKGEKDRKIRPEGEEKDEDQDDAPDGDRR